MSRNFKERHTKSYQRCVAAAALLALILIKNLATQITPSSQRDKSRNVYINTYIYIFIYVYTYIFLVEGFIAAVICQRDSEVVQGHKSRVLGGRAHRQCQQLSLFHSHSLSQTHQLASIDECCDSNNNNNIFAGSTSSEVHLLPLQLFLLLLLSLLLLLLCLVIKTDSFICQLAVPSGVRLGSQPVAHPNAL